MTDSIFQIGLAYECTKCYSIIIVVKKGENRKNKHIFRCCNSYMQPIDAIKNGYYKLPENK